MYHYTISGQITKIIEGFGGQIPFLSHPFGDDQLTGLIPPRGLGISLLQHLILVARNLKQ